MDRLGPLLDHIADRQHQVYRPGGPVCAEGIALAALALCAHGRHRDAQEPLEWLRKCQKPSGSIGINEAEDTPGWPTCWAILAWRAYHEVTVSHPLRGPFTDPIEQGLAWLGTIRGKPLERHRNMGHDTTLVGWPWVEGTHSWLEPTCLAVLAMRAGEQASTPRYKEAIRLLQDRLLPSGGANYGNTFVLQQELLPHPQPTGIVLLALAGATAPTERTERAFEYLKRVLNAETATSSLAYGMMGLDAHGQWIQGADEWLVAAAERTVRSQGFQPGITLALLALARDHNPLWKSPRACASR